MILKILVLQILCSLVKAFFLYDDDPFNKKFSSDVIEFEPINTLKDKQRVALQKNISCDAFSRYVHNCTLEAAMIRNSSRKAPPMPIKIYDWCKAIRHLTSCAIDWNSECREVSDQRFNVESINGHMHVIRNICDNEWFLARYDDLPACIETTSDGWEKCYTSFRLLVEEQKNKSSEWTHYVIHFYLCCARAQFRRCTFDLVFGSNVCTPDQAATLQKFSVILSEGDVIQDCDFNMMYSNCPGGDPKPTSQQLSKMATKLSNRSSASNSNYLYIFVQILTLIL
ncbi:hypothetical protein ACJJTC_001946 [Scirpophaga incertulas]